MSLDSLHTPSSTHPSAASSAPPPSGQSAPTVQSEVKRLTDKKEGIQAQLDVYFSVLSSNQCNMTTPLVDREGFPRSDIDVAGVRTARVNILRLRNDLRAVMDDMGELVQRGLPNVPGEAGKEQEEEVKEEGDEPFAQVDAVAPGSPAAEAGLLRTDLLLSLSTLTSTNHDRLRAVGALVGRSEGVELPVVVRRGGERVELRLTPRGGWGGRGLLGCHIVPYPSSS
ncbi:hypothetical protein JCM10207_005429 [Rhodosporidiobolus poonsookiae]